MAPAEAEAEEVAEGGDDVSINAIAANRFKKFFLQVKHFEQVKLV